MFREQGEDSMRASLAILSALLLSTAYAAAQQRTTLDIYVTDVEGGNATLFVTPAGESVLIDTGNLNGAVRDVGRIMDAVHDAGLTQIDHLILTHYHADHFGGMEESCRSESPSRNSSITGPMCSRAPARIGNGTSIPSSMARPSTPSPRPATASRSRASTGALCRRPERLFRRPRFRAPTSQIRNAPNSSPSTITWKIPCRWRATSPSAASTPRIWAI